MLPGAQVAFTIEELRQRLDVYQGIDADQLRKNLKQFLEVTVPVAEQFGVRLAMHPDDPPFPILGLPRIVSTEEDYRNMLHMVDRPANGICFCTGSLGSRFDNDLPGMVERLGSRIHALHLRNVQREENGGFFESDHLRGSLPMPAVVAAILREQIRRRDQGRCDWRLSMRPDHGHVMLDDLGKPRPRNPGYSCLGCMRGLAELRGLQLGIASTHPSPSHSPSSK
jgi:mannonate dehydratase